MKNRYNNMKKSKYDPLDVTNRLYDLNFEKYTQLHYGNLEEENDPFNLRSFNRDILYNNISSYQSGNTFNGNTFNNGNIYGYSSDNIFNGTKVLNSNYGSRNKVKNNVNNKSLKKDLLNDLNYEKYVQIQYGNLEKNDDPFKLVSYNRDNLYGNVFNDFNRLNNLNYGNKNKVKSNNFDTDPFKTKTKTKIMTNNDPFEIGKLNMANYDPLDIDTKLRELSKPMILNKDLKINPIENTNQPPQTDLNTFPDESLMMQLLQIQELKQMKLPIPELGKVGDLLGFEQLLGSKQTEKKMSDDDITILDKLKNLMDSVLKCSSEAFNINNAVNNAKNYYKQAEFVNLVDDIINRCEALNKQTSETSKEYNLLIQLINSENKIHPDKIKKIEEKLTPLISDYENIKTSYSRVFTLLKEKFNAVRLQVAAYKNKYDNTQNVIQDLIDKTGDLALIQILIRRKNFQQDNGDIYDYAGFYGVMERSILTDTLHFTNKMLTQMAIAVDNKEKDDFVVNKKTEMDGFIEVLLNDSYGIFKVDSIHMGTNILDIINNSLNYDIVGNNIFNIGVFNANDSKSLLRVLGITEYITNEVNESLNAVTNLFLLADTYIINEFINIQNFIHKLILTNNDYDNGNYDNEIVKLLAIITYHGHLGDIMVVNTYILILSFFLIFYTISPFECDVGDTGNDINLRYTKLENIDDAILNINGNDYSGLKIGVNFKDYPVSDIIMMVLFFKLKLMLHYRDAFNNVTNLFNTNDRDLTHNVYDVYINIQDLVHTNVDDFLLLLRENNKLNGTVKLNEFIRTVTSHTELLKGFKDLDLSKDGCRERALEQSKSGINETLLFHAITETNRGKGTDNSNEIFQHMVNLGLGNLFNNNSDNNKGVNKFKMILKSCDASDFLISAGSVRANYAQVLFHNLLNVVTLSTPNNNFVEFNGSKTEQDRLDYIINIIKDVHKSITDDPTLRDNVIALLNEDNKCEYRDIICCRDPGNIAKDITQAILLALDHTSAAVVGGKIAAGAAADDAGDAAKAIAENMYNTNKDNMNNAVHRIIIGAVIQVLNDHTRNYITAAAGALLDDLTDAGIESIVMAVTTTALVSINLDVDPEYITAALAISAATAINHVAWRMANNAYEVLNAVANGIDKFADVINNVSNATKPMYANTLIAANTSNAANTRDAIQALKFLIDDPTPMVLAVVRTVATGAPNVAREVAGINGFQNVVNNVFNTLNTSLSELQGVKASLDAIMNDITNTQHGNITVTLTAIAADVQIQRQINNVILRVANINNGVTEVEIIVAIQDVNIINNTVTNVNTFAVGQNKNAVNIAIEFAQNIVNKVVSDGHNGTATNQDLQISMIPILASAIAASIILVPVVVAARPITITAKNILDKSVEVLNEVVSNPNDLFNKAEAAIANTVGTTQVVDFRTEQAVTLFGNPFNNQSLALKAIGACLACKNDSIVPNTLVYSYKSIALEAAEKTTEAVYRVYINSTGGVQLPNPDLVSQVQTIFNKYFDIFTFSKADDIAESVAEYMANRVAILPLAMGTAIAPASITEVKTDAKRRALKDNVITSATYNIVKPVYDAMVDRLTNTDNLATALGDLTQRGFEPVICAIIVTMVASKHLGFNLGAANIDRIYNAVAETAIRDIKPVINVNDGFTEAINAAKNTIWNEYNAICKVNYNNVITQAHIDELVKSVFDLMENTTTDRQPIAYNVLTNAIAQNKLGDVMIFFIYNMIIHLVMFYYCNDDISYDLNHMQDDGNFAGTTGADHNIKIAATYSRYQTNGANTPIIETIIENFYMLLGRFISIRDAMNGDGFDPKIRAVRQAFITGVFQGGFDDFTYNINRVISMRSIFTCNVINDIYQYSCADSKFTMIVDYLAKLCIVPEPEMHAGMLDQKISTSMDEFRTACAQTGALLYGLFHENDI